MKLNNNFLFKLTKYNNRILYNYNFKIEYINIISTILQIYLNKIISKNLIIIFKITILIDLKIISNFDRIIIFIKQYTKILKNLITFYIFIIENIRKKLIFYDIIVNNLTKQIKKNRFEIIKIVNYLFIYIKKNILNL